MNTRRYIGLVLLIGAFVQSMLMAPLAAAQFSISPPRGAADRLLYEMKPGDTREDGVILLNSGSEKRTFSLYAVDDTKKSTTDDSIFLSSSDAEQNAIGKWVSVKSPVTIEAGEKMLVPFTIRLPETAEKEVTYRGGIVASEVAPEDTSANASGGSVSVQVSTQVALYIHIKATDTPQLTETTRSFEEQEKSTQGEAGEGEGSTKEASLFSVLNMTLALLILLVVVYLAVRSKKGTKK